MNLFFSTIRTGIHDSDDLMLKCTKNVVFYLFVLYDGSRQVFRFHLNLKDIGFERLWFLSFSDCHCIKFTSELA